MIPAVCGGDPSEGAGNDLESAGWNSRVKALLRVDAEMTEASENGKVLRSSYPRV